jgi:flagellar biosynthetic protein FliR
MFDLPYESVVVWTLMFIRIGSIIFALPLFGDEPVSVKIRVFLSLSISFIVIPLYQQKWSFIAPNDVIAFGGLALQEIMIGLVIGYFGRLIFDGFVRASTVCGYQMGFGTASLMMPGDGEMATSFDAFHRIMIVLIFFTLGMHHLFLGAIFETFEQIAPGGAVFSKGLSTLSVSSVVNFFVTTLKLAAPILVALSFTMAAMGLVARAVPQMNVFTLSFPVSFFVGLTVYIATLPLFPEWVVENTALGKNTILAVIKAMGR